MAKDILEKLEQESESLYRAAKEYAGEKWEVTDFEKINSMTFNITLSNRKKPNKVRSYRCVFDKYSWYFMGE